MVEETVEWRIDAANVRIIRMILYGWFGLVTGTLLFVIGTMLFASINLALSGNVLPIGLTVLFFLVGGPFSLLYLLPALNLSRKIPLFSASLPNSTETITERYGSVISWPWLFIASLLGTFAIGVLVYFSLRILAVFVAFWFGLLIIASAFISWGQITSDEPSMKYSTGSVPLSEIERVRQVRIGNIVICWLTYTPGTKRIRTPSLITFTRDAYLAFEDAVETAEPADSDTKSSIRGVKISALGIGFGFLVLAGGIWIFSTIDPVITVYLSGVISIFGVIFLWAGFHLT